MKNKRIDEKFVENKIKKYIKKYGFTIDSNKDKEIWEHGVDIKFKNKKYGQYFLIECKGDPGSRKKVKSISGSMSSSINSAVGQIISRMHTSRKSRYGGYRYGIGFPNTFKDKVLKRIPFYALKQLQLKIFFVNKAGKVEEYNHIKLKKIQKN